MSERDLRRLTHVLAAYEDLEPLFARHAIADCRIKICDDLVEHMQAVAEMILCAEALAKAAKHSAERLRDVLAATMQDLDEHHGALGWTGGGAT
jgi:hypothetical protein